MALDLRDRIAGRLRKMVTPGLERGPFQARVLAVASSKGGVGKTTTSVNLAVALAQGGVRTLLVDLDPQAHVSAALKLSPDPACSLSDVLLTRGRDVLEVVQQTRWANLDFAGSEKILAETEMVLSAKIGKELILAGALDVAQTHYDVIVIDCPPNLGTLTLNALCASDKLLVPTDLSLLAIEGVGDILNTVDTCRTRLGRRLDVCGVLVTRYDKRTRRTNEELEQILSELYDNLLLPQQIPQSAEINKAHLAGKPVIDFAKSSPGAHAYRGLAQTIADKLYLPYRNKAPVRAAVEASATA